MSVLTILTVIMTSDRFFRVGGQAAPPSPNFQPPVGVGGLGSWNKKYFLLRLQGGWVSAGRTIKVFHYSLIVRLLLFYQFIILNFGCLWCQLTCGCLICRYVGIILQWCRKVWKSVVFLNFFSSSLFLFLSFYSVPSILFLLFPSSYSLPSISSFYSFPSLYQINTVNQSNSIAIKGGGSILLHTAVVGLQVHSGQ